MSASRWAEITVSVAPQAADAVAEAMRAVCGGVTETTGNGRVILTGYSPTDDRVGARADAVRARVAAARDLGIDVGEGTVTVRPVVAQAWEQAWRESFQPVRVGPITVTPSWLEPPRDAEWIVTIDPGMAFGTGLHTTTRGCLAALESQLRAGESTRPTKTVIDVGTGSGVLAIAAVKLGAERAVAIDCDPTAASVARENAALNGVADRVRIVVGDLMNAVAQRAEVIVANIHAHAITELANVLPHHLQPGGRFIGSGVVEKQYPAVESALGAAGLTEVETLREDDWVTAVWEMRECRAS